MVLHQFPGAGRLSPSVAKHRRGVESAHQKVLGGQAGKSNWRSYLPATWAPQRNNLQLKKPQS